MVKPKRHCSIAKQIVAIVASVVLALQPTFAYANPQGGTVSAGQASISQSGNTLDITQTSSKAVINWTGFNIAPGETTQFFQPSSGAIALNRVNSNSASEIDGNLIANGNIIIINQNGVQFGAGSRVDVNGLVATTANISDSAFMNATGPLNFNQPGNATASIVNNGTITAAQAGLVGLVAPNVVNNGIITAKLGRVQLASGDTFTVDMYGDGLMQVAVSSQVVSQLVANNGLIQADGGKVQLTAAAGSQIINSLIDNQGTIEANSVGVGQSGEIVLYAAGNGNPQGSNVVSNEGRLTVSGKTQNNGGTVSVNAGFASNTGNITADGQNGGGISVNATSIYNSGTVSTQGLAGNGGSITFNASNMIQQASAASINASGTGNGGNITVSAGPGSIYDSASYSATGTTGGNIDILGDTVTLAAATLNADGTNGGGTILIGGDAHGAGTVQLASNTFVNPYTTITADATGTDNGGTVVVWSEDSTQFYGTISAKGGPNGGNGGWIETSSANDLTFGGFADAGAPNGIAGSLLLDPRNIVIEASGTTSPGQYIQLVDPNTSTDYGGGPTILANGNIAVADSNATIGSTADAGAVYLFNSITGALISQLAGSHANDAVGSEGITALTGNNNFVVSSPSWGSGGNEYGAATWVNGTTGALSSGTTGGVVSSANSLIGSNANDQVSTGGITALTNGNYVVDSYDWIYDSTNGIGKGAVTWGNGSNGELSTGAAGGVVSSSNSLIGSNTDDGVGEEGVVALTNGNYVVESTCWSGGCTNGLGAATWVNGSTGATSNSMNTISSSNSLVGSNSGDQVGYEVGALSNGNYVMLDPNWDGYKGAVTFGCGSSSNACGANGVTGIVSSSNSLVGSTSGTSNTGDQIGYRALELSDGNYVVESPQWNGGTENGMGAVTWMNGATGVLSNGAAGGVISSANSLIGSHAGDFIGEYGDVFNFGGGDYVDFFYSGITMLTNGNIAIGSPYWNSATGAVTWMNGATGALSNGATGGTISTSNSVTGNGAGDYAGAVGVQEEPQPEPTSGIVALTNGNYVIDSPGWKNSGFSGGTGALDGYGAVTWVNGSNGELTTGATGGVISSTNSLVGSNSTDNVGGNFYDDGLVIALSNGNYAIGSPVWNNGKGAVTFGCGSSSNSCGSNGVVGTISSSNSLVGSTGGGLSAGDEVGDGVTALTSGNYVVSSYDWDGGSNGYGAVTWVNGTNGQTSNDVNTISSTNSLVGSHSKDYVGIDGITALTNGNYVVDSDNWNSYEGAVTWGNGATGTIGTVSASNSLVGATGGGLSTGDEAGSGGITVLSNGNYVVSSPDWNGSYTNGYGAVTFGCGSSSNACGTNGVSGTISASNSLVGSHAGDFGTPNYPRSGGVVALADGNYVVINSEWNSYTGAVTWGNGSSGTSGVVSSSNSLVGSTSGTSTTGDQVGYGGIIILSNGNYVVDNPYWHGGTTNGYGAVTWVNASNGQLMDGNVGETVSASNSLVGSHTGDLVGDSDDYPMANVIVDTSYGGFVIGDPNYNSGVGELYVFMPSPVSPPQLYATNPGLDVTVTTGAITAITDTGTAVTLQANNNITVNSAITTTSGGGALTLDAGQSITITGNITTDNGVLTLLANDTNADGVVNADRLTGTAAITMASGTTLNSGTGNISITLSTGAGNTNSTGGDITLYGLTGGNITVTNNASGSGQILLDGTVAASGNFVASAYSNIVVNSPVTTQGGYMILDANNASTSSGYIDVEGNVTSNNGNITLGGGEATPTNIAAGTGYAYGNAANPNDGGGIDIGETSDFIINAGTGNIVINGHGYNNASGGGNYGIFINDVSTDAGSTLETSSGNITVNGIGGNGDGDNLGIVVVGTITTASGAISITGMGGTAGISSTYKANDGMYITGTVSSTGTGTVGAVTLNGTGANGYTDNYGVLNVGTISVAGANLSITGTGGNGAGSDVGIDNEFGAIESTGAGNITMTGYGGHYTSGSTTASKEYGIWNDGGTIESLGTGSVTVKGYGGKGTGSSFGNIGLYNFGTITTVSSTLDVEGYGGTDGTTSAYTTNLGLLNLGGTISSTCTNGCGNVTIIGTGANGYSNNYGVLDGGGNITTVAAPLTITGTGGSGTSTGNYGTYVSGNITSTGAGTITINGTGGNSAAPIYLAANVTSDNTAITFADAVQLGASSVVNSGTGALTFDSTVNDSTAHTDNLTVTGGPISFGGAWGGTTALAAVSITSNDALTLPAISATTLSVDTTASAADITVGGALALSGSSGTDLTLSSYRNIIGNATITTQGGGIIMDADNAANHSGYIDIEGNVTSNNGFITLGGGEATPTNIVAGTGYAWGNAGNPNEGDGIEIAYTNDNDIIVNAGSGNIIMNGHGYNNASANNNNGVYVGANSTLETGSGNITINGIGGNGEEFNYGIYDSVFLGTITTTSGAISLTGTGGTAGSSASDTENYGINIEGTVSSTGTGTVGAVTLNGTGANAYDRNSGVYIGGTASVADADLSITGTEGNDASANVYNAGILNFFGTIESTGAGNITMTGYGGYYASGSTTVSEEEGIYNSTFSTIESLGTGSLTVKGYGGKGLNTNIGLLNIAGTITTVSGALDVEGYGGTDGTTSTYTTNAGLYNSGAISSTCTSSCGAMTVIGTGANGYSNNYGVWQDGTISTKGANLTITGTGGSGTSTGNYGDFIDSAFSPAITSTGTGTITINGTGGNGAAPIYLAANVTSDNTAITFADAVQLGASSVVNAGTNTLTFESTIDDSTADTDTLTATGGTVNFDAAIGSGTAPSSLSATGSTVINLDGSVITGGTQTYTGPVVIGANDTLTTTNSAVDFTSTVNDATSNTHSLTISAGSGLITIGSTVGTTELASLAATSTTGIDINGSVTTGGTQTYTGPVVIGANDTLSTTNSAVDFTSTVNDGTSDTHSLTLSAGSGLVTFGSTVGTTELASLAATSTTGIDVGGSVTTGGTQTYTGPVVIGGNDTLTTTNSAVDFTSTINDGTSNTHSLTVSAGSGLVTFGSTVGTTELASLAASSSTGIDINGSVITGGNQTYTGPVVIGANDTLTTTNSAVDFTSTVNDGSSNTHSLTVSAGSGLVTFGSTVGATELASLAATSSTGIDINGSVTTGGNQTYTGPVVLGNNTTLDSSIAGGNVTFGGTLNGDYALSITSGSGTDTFDGIVGSTKLASLSDTTTGAIDINTTAISTTGNQTYTGPVVLGNNTTLDSSTAGGNVTFGGTLDGAHTLAIDTGTGNVTFSGVVGGNNPLTGLNVDPATIYINANVSTAGNQVYDGNVVLTSNAILNSNSSSANGNITFDDKVDGDGVSGRSLTLTSGTGTDTFDGVVGTTPLSSLADTASHIDLDGGSITTTGNQTYTGAVAFGTNTTLSSSGGTIGFTSTVDGDDNLTASANAFSFGGAIGGGTPLDAVSLTSTNALTLPAISATSIVAQTTGATSDITIANGSILTASGSNTAITLASADNFINDEGSGALSTLSGRWLIYSTNPADNTLDSLTANFDRYSCTYGGSCPSFPSTGDGLLYSYSPTLTATPTGGISLNYGAAPPSLTGYSYSVSGYLPGELTSDNVTGSLNGSTNYTQGSADGSYSINYSSGSLASALGYGFSYANNSTGITVTGSSGGGSPPVDSAITLPSSVEATLSNYKDGTNVSVLNNTIDLQYCDQCGCSPISPSGIIHSNCNAGGNAGGT